MRLPTYNGSLPYIFVSYAHKDSETVLPILSALQENGFRLWFDQGIEAGTEWPQYIARHLERSAKVLVFMSKAAAESKNCRREIYYAIEVDKEPLVIYLEDVELESGLKMQLNVNQAMYRKRFETDAEFIDALSNEEQMLCCCEGHNVGTTEGEVSNGEQTDPSEPEVVFPVDAIVEYIAVKWMEESISRDWLRYDRIVEEKRARRKKAREKGIVMPPVDDREEYCNCVREDNENKNYFGFAIQEECFVLDETGVGYDHGRWEEYCEKLFNEIKKNAYAEIDTNIVSRVIECCRRDVKKTGDAECFKAMFVCISDQMKLLFERVKESAELKADDVKKELLNKKLIEQYLYQHGVMLHPNSVRYLLYRLEKDLRAKTTELRIEDEFSELEQKTSNFFAEEKFHDRRSGAKVDISRYVESMDDDVMSKRDVKQEAQYILDRCEAQIQDIVRYYRLYIESSVIATALSRVDKLCKAYERLFMVLEKEVELIPLQSADYIKRFRNQDGGHRIYVCASKTCFEGFLRECPPGGADPIQLTAELRENIFHMVVDAEMNPGENRYRDMIDFIYKDMLVYWKDAVNYSYREKIDIGLEAAVLKEAEFVKLEAGTVPVPTASPSESTPS